MASVLIHICISNIVKEELGLSDKFLAGSIMPDLKKMAGFDRAITHYLKYVVHDGNVMHLPDLDKFIEENTFKLLDFKTLGTYAHLIEDKIWFEKFVGRYIKWHDEDLGLVTNLKTGKVYDFDIFSKEIYSDYISVSQKVISKYNLDMNKLSKQIKENLNDKVLISCFDKYLNDINNKNVSNKRYFLTDEDLDNYISMSTKEVIKRINELR